MASHPISSPGLDEVPPSSRSIPMQAGRVGGIAAPAGQEAKRGSIGLHTQFFGTPEQVQSIAEPRPLVDEPCVSRGGTLLFEPRAVIPAPVSRLVPVASVAELPVAASLPTPEAAEVTEPAPDTGDHTPSCAEEAPGLGETTPPLPELVEQAHTNGAAHGPFRAEALRARYQEGPPPPLPAVQGSRWLALTMLTTCVAILGATVYWGQVEITSKALGALRIQGGPRVVTAQAFGTVTLLDVAAGDQVQAGQTLARIESTDLRARVESSARQLEMLRKESKKVQRTTEELREHSVAALKQKKSLLWQRAKLTQEQEQARSLHAGRVRELERLGAASHAEAMTAEESAALARSELLALRQQAADTEVAIQNLKHSYATDQVERELRVHEAAVRLAEAETMALLGLVNAPESGRLESVLVRSGQVVQAGQHLARIVPQGKPSSAVVFAPAKDASFLRAGTTATLEFPSLSTSEFGKARAKVRRVATDVALPAEVNEVLGGESETAASGLVRVELEIVPDETWRKMQPLLGSGARVIARLETRQRRILTLFFDFLNEWYSR